MKKTIFWVGLSFLLVTTAVLSARPAAEGAVVGETPLSDGPQYGGTLTYFENRSDKDPEAPDEMKTTSVGFLCFLQAVQRLYRHQQPGSQCAPLHGQRRHGVYDQLRPGRTHGLL